MTLIITAITTKGIYQSSDNRISVEGKWRDDNSIKHLSVHCPDGTALLAWTGLAELKDKTKITDWVRQTIRGTTRTVEETLLFITNQANQKVADYCYYHREKLGLVFSIGSYINQQSWYYEITNINSKDHEIKPKFSITKKKIEKVICFSGGSGSRHISLSDRKLLHRSLIQTPRKKEDYMCLMSAITKRVSAMNPQEVSPSSLTVYMPASGRPVEAQINEENLLVPTNIPSVILGIDHTELNEILTRALLAGKMGNPLSKEAVNGLLEKAAITSITPQG